MAGRTHRAFLGDDERGMFAVMEAIMVAVLVFTAILFFTGVGRPTDSAEPGGIDLAQNAADILDILRSRTFQGRPFADTAASDGWVTALVDPADPDHAQIQDEVTDLVSEIVPAGSLFVLRLANGLEPRPADPPGPEPAASRTGAAWRRRSSSPTTATGLCTRPHSSRRAPMTPRRSTMR
jgi:hypothetical protein